VGEFFKWAAPIPARNEKTNWDAGAFFALYPSMSNDDLDDIPDPPYLEHFFFMGQLGYSPKNETPDSGICYPIVRSIVHNKGLTNLLARKVGWKRLEQIRATERPVQAKDVAGTKMELITRSKFIQEAITCQSPSILQSLKIASQKQNLGKHLGSKMIKTTYRHKPTRHTKNFRFNRK